MTFTFKTFGKIVLSTALSAALILPATMTTAVPQAQAATTTTTFKGTGINDPAGIKKGQQIVNTAKQYIGKVKYVWGKNDPSKLIFDCSSFTKFIYKKYGINIKWGANSAYKQATPIKSKKNLRVGDLVYLSVRTPGHIGHVGIYAGNGQMIHNAPGKGVQMASLEKGYWSTRFVAGGRYF